MNQDCRMCACHTIDGRCSKDVHTGKDKQLTGWARCRLHDKTIKWCDHYFESPYLREYYTKHPQSE